MPPEPKAALCTSYICTVTVASVEAYGTTLSVRPQKSIRSGQFTTITPPVALFETSHRVTTLSRRFKLIILLPSYFVNTLLKIYISIRFI